MTGTNAKAVHQDSLPRNIDVVPFGRYGAGVWTAHPIGLVIVASIILIGFVGIPEARWFLAGSVPLGCLCGLFLWLRHR